MRTVRKYKEYQYKKMSVMQRPTRHSHYVEEEPRNTVFQKPITKAFEFQTKGPDEIDIMRSDNKGLKGVSQVQLKATPDMQFGVNVQVSTVHLSGQKAGGKPSPAGGKPTPAGRRDTPTKTDSILADLDKSQPKKSPAISAKNLLGEINMYNSRLPDERSLLKHGKPADIKQNFQEQFADILALGSQLPLGSRMETSHTHVGPDIETDQQALEMLDDERINTIKDYEHEPMRGSVRSSGGGSHSHSSPNRFLAQISPNKNASPNQAHHLNEIGELSPIHQNDDSGDAPSNFSDHHKKAAEKKKSRESSQERVVEEGDPFVTKYHQKAGMQKPEPQYFEEKGEMQKRSQPSMKDDGPEYPVDSEFGRSEKKLNNPEDVIHEAEDEEEHEYEQLNSKPSAHHQEDFQGGVEVKAKKHRGEVEKRSGREDPVEERAYEFFSTHSGSQQKEKPTTIDTSSNYNVTSQNFATPKEEKTYNYQPLGGDSYKFQSSGNTVTIDVSANYNVNAGQNTTPKEEKKYNYQPLGDSYKYQSGSKPSAQTSTSYNVNTQNVTPKEGEKRYSDTYKYSSGVKADSGNKQNETGQKQSDSTPKKTYNYTPLSEIYKSQPQNPTQSTTQYKPYNPEPRAEYSGQKTPTQRTPKLSARGKYSDPFGEEVRSDQSASFSSSVSHTSARQGQPTKQDASYQSPYVNPYAKEQMQPEPTFNTHYQNPYKNPYESQQATSQQNGSPKKYQYKYS